MVCHYCGYEEKVISVCPSCGSPHIGAFKAGTQQVEELIKKEFPQAGVLRMDLDTTREKESYEKILSAFADQEADILVGTQMIVKGHDFPNVTLVGVLAADLSLYMSDFRAAERTFALLCQAAGRAGRGSVPGEAVIQSYHPEHYSIQTAARQDYEAFFERFAPFGLEVEVLSRFRTPAQQKRALKAFAEGTIDVLIGTHRLLSADVNPKNLGLVIIDEEQRFGVQHKEQLKNLREQIDVLTLSATPIPRTMQMATSGVRDMSLITTPPTGRRPVIVHVGEYDSDVVSAAIRLEVGRGGQVYYVSNRVKTIDDAVARVHEAAPEARVGVAHGKMSPREVEDVMIEFATKKIDVLIATTIVESGIDNATANTLIIEDSQRLGLAQLYQLKGRVGRSATQAYAYFMFPGELPLTEEATARLTALSEFQDLGSGMRIAMRDLEIRGAGSLMGAEQHGNLSSVGFDLFTQMLGQAVAEARGDDDAGVEAASVGINLPADYFLSEEYLPAVDQRVLVYRKLAAAEDLESIDEVQEETEAAHGELPLAGLNLFNRARIRIRGERLGLESVTLSGGRITFLGVDVPKKVAFELKTRYGAVNFPKSRKLSVPYKAGAGAGSGLGRGLDANDGTGPVAAALMLLQQLGASDDD